MNLLAFETSSQQGSVAIQVDGKVTEKFMRSSKQQTRDLLPLTKTLLTEANIKLTDRLKQLLPQKDYWILEGFYISSNLSYQHYL